MAAERLSMRQIREILRQKWTLGLSHRAVAPQPRGRAGYDKQPYLLENTEPLALDPQGRVELGPEVTDGGSTEYLRIVIVQIAAKRSTTCNPDATRSEQLHTEEERGCRVSQPPALPRGLLDTTALAGEYRCREDGTLLMSPGSVGPGRRPRMGHGRFCHGL
jgi:hypothetical protein